MRKYTPPTDYMAALYKPATHAPKCDHYLFWTDLEPLGVTVAKSGEVRVPKALNEELSALGEFVFTTCCLGMPMLALPSEEAKLKITEGSLS